MNFKVFFCFIIAVFIMAVGACSSSPGGGSSSGGSSSSTSSIPAADSFSLIIGGTNYNNKGYVTNTSSTNFIFIYVLSDNLNDATNGINALEVMFANTITNTGTYSSTNFLIIYALNAPANEMYILISGNVTLSSYANSPGQSFIGSITGSCMDTKTNIYSMSGSFNIVR